MARTDREPAPCCLDPHPLGSDADVPFGQLVGEDTVGQSYPIVPDAKADAAEMIKAVPSAAAPAATVPITRANEP